MKIGKRRDSKDREKFERRILEELQRIFTETDSFYYCLDGDLTNSLQRQCDLKEKNKEFLNNKGLWRTVDDRFFWNKFMLQDIISLDVSTFWAVLLITVGFVQCNSMLLSMSILFMKELKLCIFFPVSSGRSLDSTNYSRFCTNWTLQSSNRIWSSS